MASTGEVWKLGHRPALDGVRGVAILCVLAGHAIHALEPVAWAGVTLFFGLSGFLITALLLEERGDTGRIDLARFWLRRARRLLPALVVALVVFGAFVAPLGYRMPWGPVLGYYGNWVAAEGGHLGFWAHTWSLAIEEQFYLVWPLLVVTLRTRRAVLVGCLVGVAWSVVANVVLWGDFVRVYHGTDTRMWALLAGAGLAAWLVGSTRPRRSWPALSVGPVLRWFAHRSYGIYLWHWPLVILFGEPGVPGPPVLGIPLGLLFAEVSWRYVERPILSWRGSVGAVEPAQGEPDEGVVLPGERLHLGGDLRVRR